MTTKIGVVDVGGGFRGIYGAGVLDYCIHNGIWFNLGIGIRDINKEGWYLVHIS